AADREVITAKSAVGVVKDYTDELARLAMREFKDAVMSARRGDKPYEVAHGMAVERIIGAATDFAIQNRRARKAAALKAAAPAPAAGPVAKTAPVAKSPAAQPQPVATPRQRPASHSNLPFQATKQAPFAPSTEPAPGINAAFTRKSS